MESMDLSFLLVAGVPVKRLRASLPALISHKEIYFSNAHALLVGTVREWKGEKATAGCFRK